MRVRPRQAAPDGLVDPAAQGRSPFRKGHLMDTPVPADMLHLVSRTAEGADIRFGDCETVIRLRVSTDGQGVVRVAQSHFISPPDAGRSSRPQPTTDLVAGRALAAAIGALSFQFRRGLSQGHLPDESWFISIPTLVAG